MSSRQVILASIAALCLSAGFLAGCPCPGTPLVAYHFEGDCADATCGFTVTPAGQASRVTAIAPGEHVLQLEPNTVIDQAFTLPLAGASSEIVLGYVARCENGASLGVTVTVSETRTGDGGLATPNISTRTGSTSPTMDWTRYETPVFSATGAGGRIGTATVIGLRIQSSGAGRCWVDDIELATMQYCS
ncbi:MAG: hypothetical protein WCJ30_04595 [Deltaproteobacteria bacterium]